MLPPFVIATWNIWEDDGFVEYLHSYILRELFENGEEGKEETPHYRPSLDVITFQEVTPEFCALFLALPTVRAEWVVTDLTHQLGICPPNPYGTEILIRKNLLFVRCECIGASQRLTMRIGKPHFESHPEDKRKRREQFEVSAEILTSTVSFFFNDSSPRASIQSEPATPTEFVPAILTGDCNICSYDELNPLLNPGSDGPTFIDAFLAARPIKELTDCDSGSPLSPFTSHPTFGVTSPNRKPFRFGFNFGSYSGKKRSTHRIPEARRLDYIFTHGLHPASESLSRGIDHKLEADLFGDEPVCEKSEAEDEMDECSLRTTWESGSECYPKFRVHIGRV
ncbi:hypothetical protein ACEPAI_1212 [Sanghuangporus weigelae]